MKAALGVQIIEVRALWGVNDSSGGLGLVL
jgi:hypothetical protein